MEQTSINQASDRWFFFTLLYLIFDYGRPQDIIPIEFLRPLMFIIAVLVYYIVTSGDFYKTKSPQMKLIWMFCLLLSAYVPFARNNFFAFATTRNMLLFIPFILSTIICVDSIKRLKLTINICVILLIYISCYSLVHKGRGSGNYFKDENDLALYINTWLPFCYFLFLHETRVKTKLLYGLGLVLGIISVVVSFSRGGFVGLVCLGFSACLFSSRKMLSFLLIVVIAGTFYISVPDRYLTRMSTISETQQGTALERRLSWRAAWDMFLDKPWGVGGNNFQVWFSKYQPQEMKRGMWGRVAHSLWFTLISELGIPGIIIYFLLLIYNIKDIIFLMRLNIGVRKDLQHLKILSLAFITAFIGFFISASFISVLYYPHYWYLTGIIVASVKIAKSILSPIKEIAVI